MTAQLVRWCSEDGFRCAIVKRGRKLLHAAVIGHPVSVVKLPLSEERRMTPLDQPLRKACNRMLKAGKHLGITKAAKRLLKEAKA